MRVCTNAPLTLDRLGPMAALAVLATFTSACGSSDAKGGTGGAAGLADAQAGDAPVDRDGGGGGGGGGEVGVINDGAAGAIVTDGAGGTGGPGDGSTSGGDMAPADAAPDRVSPPVDPWPAPASPVSVRSWKTPAAVHTSPASEVARFPAVAADDAGRSVVVWQHDRGVRAATRMAGGVWSAPATLDDRPGDAYRAREVRAGLDGNGRALALWTQGEAGVPLPSPVDDSIQGVWASQSDGAGWTARVRLGMRPASRLQLSQSPNGQVLASWIEGADLMVTRWAAGAATWSPPLKVDTKDDAIEEARVAVDGTGRGLAIWTQATTLWGATLAPGGASAPFVVQNDLNPPWAVGVAMEPAGRGLVVWRNDTPARVRLSAAPYHPTAGLGVPETVIDSAAVAAISEPPRAAMDRLGNAFVLWLQDNGTSSVTQRRYDARLGWQPARAIERYEPMRPSAALSLAVDGYGRALALWTKKDASLPVVSAWSAAFDPAAGTWGQPTLIEASDGDDTNTPALGLTYEGRAWAAWSLGFARSLTQADVGTIWTAPRE